MTVYNAVFDNSAVESKHNYEITDELGAYNDPT
jgi:hypothetical protein